MSNATGSDDSIFSCHLIDDIGLVFVFLATEGSCNGALSCILLEIVPVFLNLLKLDEIASYHLSLSYFQIIFSIQN